MGNQADVMRTTGLSLRDRLMNVLDCCETDRDFTPDECREILRRFDAAQPELPDIAPRTSGPLGEPPHQGSGVSRPGFVKPEWWDAMWESLTRHVLAERPNGCICPPGSEATCQGLLCPRRGWKLP